MDMEGEAGHVLFGVAEIQEIFDDAVGTDISDEVGGQSEWSLADCQEILDEVLLKRKVALVENASEETASLDEPEDALAKKDSEYPAVIMSTAGECNDDPGGGEDIANHDKGKEEEFFSLLSSPKAFENSEGRIGELEPTSEKDGTEGSPEKRDSQSVQHR